MEQHSEEWFQARLGKFSASEIYNLMVKGRGKGEHFGATALEYIKTKLAERMTGERPQISSVAMDWGTNHEEEARKLYEVMTGNQVQEVGFIQLGSEDNQFYEWAGGSPDGVVEGEVRGIIEIKCPYNTTNHLESWIEDGIPAKYYNKYYAQCQFNMMCTDAKWCDFVSYDPRIKNPKKRLFIKRIEKDPLFCSELLDRLYSAIELIKEWEAKLK